MWDEIKTNTGGDHVTRSAGAALLCGILTRRLSDRRPELESLSETLCWVILAIVFKSAAESTSKKYRPEKAEFIGWNASKRLPASALSLWLVALCLVIYWFFAAENSLVAFLPALMPLLLVSQNRLIWQETDVPGASPTSPQVFSCLSNTVWGSALVALFSILTLKSDWHVRAPDTLLLVPVAALLVAYITLDSRPRISKRYHRYLPPLDLDDALLPLSLRVTLVAVTSLGLETLAFGFPVWSAYTPALALTKALSWYFTIQTVCTSTSDSFIVLILTRCLGSTLFLAHCCSHNNLQHFVSS